MTESSEEFVDPRVLRTRRSLQKALEGLLVSSGFDGISVQEIAEAAGVNRATFYDHYADKFALLECMVGMRFGELLGRRGIQFDGGCFSALKGLFLGACDYLAESAGSAGGERRRIEPHLESAVIAVLRRNLLEGLRGHAAEGCVPVELRAAMMGGAIYGAAKEWVGMSGRCSPEEMAEAVAGMMEAMTAPEIIGVNCKH